ncbi:MAG: DUF1127 domain-containing protein [Geminicoccaceae bacterium]
MIKQPSSRTMATIGRPPSASFFPWLDDVCKVIGLWAARSRQRHHLAELDNIALRDIGLTHRDVQREIAKPFWRP